MGARSKLIQQRRKRSDPLLGAAYAPSGYEFTGELRKPRYGDYFLVAASADHGPAAYQFGPWVTLDNGINDGKRWILIKEC